MYLKKGACIVLFIILMISFSFSITLKVGVYNNYPWEYVENNSIQGILPDVLSFVSKKNNWKIEYTYLDYDSLHRLFDEKKIDVIAGTIDRDPEVKNGFFTRISTRWIILVKKSSDKRRIISIFDLRNATVATENILHAKFLEQMAKKFKLKINILVSDTPLAVLKNLQKGTADFALVDTMYLNNKNIIKGLKQTRLQFPTMDIGFLFSKENSSYFKIFNNEIINLKKNKESIYYKDLAKYTKAEKTKEYPRWLYYAIFMSLVFFIFLIYIALLLNIKIKKTTKEIEEKNLELIAENKKLQNLRKRISLLNKKVEKSYQKLDFYINRLDRLYDIFSEIIKNDSDEEDISEKILNFTIDSIREANCGSVSIKREDKWVFLAAVGHDKDMLNRLELKSQYFIMPEKTILLKNIENKDIKIMPAELYSKFSKALLPIKETILAPIRIGNNVRGNLAVDISKSVKGSFSKASLRIASNMSSVCSAFLTMKSYIKIQKDYQREMILTLIEMLELFDPYTEGHSEFVAQYSENLARLLKLSKRDQSTIYWAGLLHDIGKIGVPKEILNKPGPLTKEEFDKVKEHPLLGYSVLNASKDLKEIAIIVRQHHERYDGKGYPDGLKGKEICLGARIISIIDAWEAMTAERPYKEALNFDEAIEEIKRNLGTQFDPEIGKMFLQKMLRAEVEDVRSQEEK